MPLPLRSGGAEKPDLWGGGIKQAVPKVAIVYRLLVFSTTFTLGQDKGVELRSKGNRVAGPKGLRSGGRRDKTVSIMVPSRKVTYSTVTLLARFLGLSTSVPFWSAT